MKYLFKAHFQDGAQYQQNAQDVSISDSGRSCFFDVQQELNRGNEIVLFSLSNGVNAYHVNLIDGTFSIQGEQPDICPDSNLIIPEDVSGPFRLVYFRRHTHNFNDPYNAHWFTYNFGWQTTHNGVNIKKILEVKD
jgi:hypothetical protein